jgi:hypothetical protein
MADALGQSPAYLAYLRTLGVEDATDQANTQTSVDAAQRRQAMLAPRIAQSGEYAREGISGGYESRGLFRSGQHEVGLARQRQAEGQQLGDLTSATTDQVTALKAALAAQMAARRRAMAEQGLNAANALYTAQGNDALQSLALGG